MYESVSGNKVPTPLPLTTNKRYHQADKLAMSQMATKTQIACYEHNEGISWLMFRSQCS